MTSDDTKPSRTFARISPETKALAAQAMKTSGRDMSRPIAEIRAMSRAAYAAGSDAVVQSTGVTLSESVIAGVRCMVIDPPNRRANREVVYLFGGGFSLGSPFDDLPISAKLAALTGARMIAPEYPLAPEHPYPAALVTSRLPTSRPAHVITC